MRHYFIKEELIVSPIMIHLTVRRPREFQRVRLWLTSKILGLPIEFKIQKKIMAPNPYLERVDDLEEEDFMNDGEVETWQKQ